MASVSDLNLASSPVFWDFYVNLIHPCRFAIFSDNGGVTSPIVASIKDTPHPSPIYEIINDFPYDLEITYDCGPQTISLVPQALAEGTMADFILLTEVNNDWIATIAPINLLQGPQVYTLELEVVLDLFPNVVYKSPTTFEVELRDPCLDSVLTIDPAVLDS